MFEKSIVVRFGECDGLGHVNNGTYFTYFEDARIDVFRLFNPDLSLSNWNLIVASTRADFLKPATYAQTLSILTWIGRIGNSSFTVEQVMMNQAKEYVARGQTSLIAYDYAAGRSVPLWPAVHKGLAEHLLAPDGVPELH